MDNLDNIINDTLQQHAATVERLDSQAPAAFHWPWSIASAGAQHLRSHRSAIDSLVSSGGKVLASPAGPGVVAAVSQGPTNPTNTNLVLNDGLFGPALSSVKADELLRTVLVGFSTDAQLGILGGGGGAGVAYDIVNHANRRGVAYDAIKVGIGGKVTAGLVVGAMTEEPEKLNESTCVWEFGATIVAIGVAMQVIMRSSNLSLLGFAMNLGGGVGLSSSSGYGSIKVV